MLIPELFGFALEMRRYPGLQFRPIAGMNAAKPLVGIPRKLSFFESQQRLPAGGELESIGFEIPVPESILSSLNGQRQMAVGLV